jgi:putative NADPH-quinone reductase
MNVLIIHSNPNPDGFTYRIISTINECLGSVTKQINVLDLYKMAFPPVLSPEFRKNYSDIEKNKNYLKIDEALIVNANVLLFVYPTWWYSFPAIMKGFIDQTFLPGLCFDDEQGKLRPKLNNLKIVGGITTFAADQKTAQVFGDLGRLTIEGLLKSISPVASSLWMALYDIKGISEAEKSSFLLEVSSKLQTSILGATVI